MFTDMIFGLEFAKDYLNEIFPNIQSIKADGFSDDTFISTLRVLLKPRLKEDEYCFLESEYLYTNKDAIDSKGVRSLLSELPMNTLKVVGTAHTSPVSLNNRIVDVFDEEFTSTFEGYEELRDLREFFAGYSKARFYINKTCKSTLVFISGMNMKLYHLVQFMTSRLLPWYFENSPLTEKERRFVKSLTKSDPGEYQDFLQEYVQQFGIREKKIEYMTHDLAQKVYQSRLDSVETSLASEKRSLDANIAAYKTIVETIDDLSIRKAGLEEIIRSGGGDSRELRDYLISNKNVELIVAFSGIIEIEVKGTFENFDPDIYERLSNNENSYLYNGYSAYGVFVSRESRKKLLDAIFSEDPVLKIQTCGAFQLDTRGIVNALSRYDFSRSNKNRIPNCHLDLYACLGNQKPIIEKALRDGDFVRAIEQCICSVESINIGESTTFSSLLRNLFCNCEKKCILLPDGTECTPTEALDWLRDDGYFTCPECGAVYKTKQERDACRQEHN